MYLLAYLLTYLRAAAGSPGTQALAQPRRAPFGAAPPTRGRTLVYVSEQRCQPRAERGVVSLVLPCFGAPPNATKLSKLFARFHPLHEEVESGNFDDDWIFRVITAH